MGRREQWVHASSREGRTLGQRRRDHRSTATGAVAASALNGIRRPTLPYGFSPFEVGAEAEELEFRAADGVRLAGWWLDQPDSEIVVICAHGHRSSMADMLGIGPGLWRAGHSVFLFDFRSRGLSDDGPMSLAHREQLDLRAAVDLVTGRRPGARIAVVGFSMGASVALLCAADDPRIGFLVLDSPFASMRGVVAHALRSLHLPAKPLLPVASLMNRALHGYSYAHVRPVDVIAQIPPRPVLLLHGTEDSIVPFSEAELLVEAVGRDHVEFVPFDGADHCGGYFADRPGYIALVDDFLRRSLGAAAPGGAS